jgi:hypothetical protein
MKFRLHRGTLTESMTTVREITSRTELLRVVAADLAPLRITDEMIRTVHYGPDSRINWKDSYLVIVDGFGVAGFTDGPI